MEKISGGAKLNTPIDRLVDWYSYKFKVDKESAEDIVNEFYSVGIAYICGERDDYEDLGEIIWDYLGIETNEFLEITRGY